MLTTFAVIGGVGLLIALVSLVFGEVLDGLFEVDFAPDGAISTSSLAATMAGFGFGGAIAITVFHVDVTWLAVAIAAAVGAASWLVSFVMYRQLKKAGDPDGASDISQLEGATGTVITAPYKKGALGELSVPFRGQPLKINFLCDANVKVGQEVVVTSVLSASQVKVKVKRAAK